MSKNNPDKTNGEKRSGRRVTQRDIAEKAGVSHVAVSFALRNNPQVSAETRERIHTIAAEMGYEPDPMLSALSQYRLSSQDRPVQAELALINPLKNPDDLRDPREFRLYWEGAVQAAKQRGFRVEEFCTAEIPLQRMEKMFKARHIRGIILAKPLSQSFQDETIDWQSFSWQDFSTVRLGRKADYPQAHYVTSAQSQNTMMAFARIAKKGYRRIGYIGQYTEAQVFCAGFLFAQLAVQEKHRIPPLLSLAEAPNDGENKYLLKHWLEQHRPDAILTERRDLPELLEDLGYRAPDDIGLAATSIHDTPINAGIEQNSEQIGSAAVRLLASLISHNECGIPSIRNEVLIEGNWIDGSMLPSRL